MLWIAPLLLGETALSSVAKVNKSTPLRELFYPHGYGRTPITTAAPSSYVPKAAHTTVVLPSAEYSKFWDLPLSESVIAFRQGHNPLERYGAAARGSIFAELVRLVDEMNHPDSEFEEPVPGWRIDGRRRPAHQATCHYLRDGKCILSKGASMRWSSEVCSLVKGGCQSPNKASLLLRLDRERSGCQTRAKLSSECQCLQYPYDGVA